MNSKSIWYALFMLLAGSAAVTSQAQAQAQSWPQKPITFVVPFAAGGGTDAFARPLAAQLDMQLGTRVLIENRAGAGGTVGASQALITPSRRRSIPISTIIWRRTSSPSH